MLFEFIFAIFNPIGFTKKKKKQPNKPPVEKYNNNINANK